MKLYSWNVNGIRAVAKKGKIQEFMEEHQPDVLCLQETKANQDQTPVHFDGYHETWHDGQRKGYSGTAIYSKEAPLTTTTGFPESIMAKYKFEDEYGDTSKEGRVLTVEFDDYYVVTVYTPNSKRDLSRLHHRKDIWDPAFTEYCKDLEKTKPVLMSGDFNVAHKEVDIARPKDNKRSAGFTEEERAGMDHYISEGFIDTFRMIHPDATDAYTWWSAWGNTRERNVGWRIDYWLVSSAMAGHIVDAQIHSDVYGSDHCPVSIELN